MKGIGFEYMYIYNRSGEMPLLLLCLPADVFPSKCSGGRGRASMTLSGG